MDLKREDLLLLFDVDGTLTQPRQLITKEMETFLYQSVLPRATLGLVGGSDLEKMCEQLNGPEFIQKFDYVFAENGLVHYEAGKEMGKMSIIEHIGNDMLKTFINFCLHYIADLDLPIKRGTFIEFRNGMLNISPIGRNCSREEREQFYKYDEEFQVRRKMIEDIKAKFPDMDLVFSVGGQISFDVYPTGWDKSFCLSHVAKRKTPFREIHFFGDKTNPGGNDYEIYMDPRTIGHRVESPDDTKEQVTKLLKL
uniref:Phosphomannomutase n=1 Tax=Anopheles culicifacies TaxID=139723 RepID=A0A182LXJ3_9DIPT